MSDYPDFDIGDETAGGYTAAVVFDTASFSPLVFPGAHAEYCAARTRAFRCATALRAAGELGVKAHVGCVGERPAGFPRNGVFL